MEQTNSFSYSQMFWKGMKYFVVFLLPVLVDKFIYAYPDIAQLTVGAILVLILNFLKNKVGLKII